ncbi:PLDc N-terminal domain-containing protein [Fusibacter sp. JL298sf-3]
MTDLKNLLPIVVPFALLHFGLAIFCLVHLYKRKKVRVLNVPIWVLIILLIQTFGSIGYLLFGRVDT